VLALAVFKTYFSGPNERAQGLVASLGIAVQNGREKQTQEQQQQQQ
jgi:hypothetical protein